MRFMPHALRITLTPRSHAPRVEPPAMSLPIKLADPVIFWNNYLLCIKFILGDF